MAAIEPERWERIKSLFHQAWTSPHAERAAFLERACATDVELRHDVEALLAQHTSGFLDDPALIIARGLDTEIGDPVIGRRLGAYDVQALLGAGGMGEVYRAHDSRLGRDVAIKILPRAFTRDPDRLERFEREARILAALNHPHIGTIYGLEESQVGTGSKVSALVLELVEGETLADRLRRGAMPMDDVLNVAEQIADALHAAHEKGIVHRDLKPANIKITPGGVVKVLDFGIAKVADFPAGASQMSAAPTTVVGATDGVILGTAAYMSPEQARGAAIDQRTDIWAFGCVLYQMLTGRMAFAGETASDTIAAVLEREPAWDALPKRIPRTIRRVLHQCLEKDQADRLSDIGDVRIVLEEARTAQSARSSWVMRLALASAVLVALVAAIMMAFVVAKPARGGGVPELTQRQVTANPSDDAVYTAVISPDGTQLAYADLEGVHLRALDTGEVHNVPPSPGFCFR